MSVVVIGAGPTGLACGIELTRRGVDNIIFDKGCLVNSLYNYPTHMTFFTTPELLEIGDIPMTSLNDKPTRTEALKYYRRVAEHYKLNIHQYEHVESFSGTDGNFSVKTSKGTYGANKIVISSGYYDVPNLLGVPGEDLPKVVHYYKEAHPCFGHDVMVIGAKNSAAIIALELYRTGARVTLVHRGPDIHRHVKYWIKPDIENRIKNNEIKAYFKTSVTEIKPESVVLETPEGRIEIANQFVFAMTGYRPDLTFLNAHGIHFQPATRKPIVNTATLESERPGVFLAGVIVAGMHTNEIFIENGRFHGALIAEAIAQQLR
ncbi:MAG: FAD-dependent pyridine nucleotide-disulfide oxidoreductase [Bryobacterales bacterium]|nr:FAD-dependent pyridine nucleotide-disulfide oxidoreductase [Bryobacterales bacterium]